MVWLNNFSTSFASHAAALGFTDANVNSVKADATMLNFLVGDLVPTYKAALQARTSYKSLLMTGPLGSRAETRRRSPSRLPRPRRCHLE